MHIPDEAVEAVLRQDKSWPEKYNGGQRAALRATVRRDLEPAAPFVAAQEVFRIETQAPNLTFQQMEWLARRRQELEAK